MKQLTSTEIRRMFLDFFVEKGHKKYLDKNQGILIL